MDNSKRKVIQYITSADSTDFEDGHGTHAAGTLVGKCPSSSSVNSNPSNSNPNEWQGIASGAKIVFFDAGIGSLPLVIPSLYRIVFPLAYNAGARVYSNSWYNILFSYYLNE